MLVALPRPLSSDRQERETVKDGVETVPRFRYIVERGCSITARMCGYSGRKNMRTAIPILHFLAFILPTLTTPLYTAIG